MYSRNGLSLCAGLILLAVFAFCPAQAAAQSITFRNDTTFNIVVIPGSVTPQGNIKRDRPYQLAPKDSTAKITLPGNRVVTIYDSKAPNRVIYQGTLPNNNQDLLISIQPDTPPKVKLSIVTK